MKQEEMRSPDAGELLTGSAAVVVFLLLIAYAVVAVPVVMSAGMTNEISIASVVLGFVLIALTAIDLNVHRLPDVLTLPLIVMGLALAYGLGWPDPVWHGIAAAIGFLSFYLVNQIYQAIRGMPGLGLGDAKLFAAAGAWVGLQGLISVCVWASVLSLLALGLAWLTGREMTRTTKLPFGPALAFGFWLVWLYGPIV